MLNHCKPFSFVPSKYAFIFQSLFYLTRIPRCIHLLASVVHNIAYTLDHSRPLATAYVRRRHVVFRACKLLWRFSDRVTLIPTRLEPNQNSEWDTSWHLIILTYKTGFTHFLFTLCFFFLSIYVYYRGNYKEYKLCWLTRSSLDWTWF